jgi:hypothetical protein
MKFQPQMKFSLNEPQILFEMILAVGSQYLIYGPHDASRSLCKQLAHFQLFCSYGRICSWDCCNASSNLGCKTRAFRVLQAFNCGFLLNFFDHSLKSQFDRFVAYLILVSNFLLFSRVVR